MSKRKLLAMFFGVKGLVLLFSFSLVAGYYCFLRNAVAAPCGSITTAMHIAADADTYDSAGFTPLMKAVEKGIASEVKSAIRAAEKVELEKKWVKYRAINEKAKSGETRTALHIGVYKGNNTDGVGNVKNLLMHGANTRARDFIKSTPAHYLGQVDNLDARMNILIELFRHGADINAQNILGNTLAHRDAERGDQAWGEKLLNQFGSVLNLKIKNHKGQTPSDTAREFKNERIAEVFDKKIKPIGNGGDVGARDKNGYTGLMLAAIRDDKKFAENLIKLGTNKNLKTGDTYLQTAFHVACLHQKPEMAFLLVDKGVNVNEPNGEGDTPLHYVLRLENGNGQKKAATALMNKKADVNAKNNAGYTPVHEAVWRNSVDFIKLITQSFINDIDPSVKDKQGRTALDLAIKLDRKIIKEYLQSLTEARGVVASALKEAREIMNQ